MSNHIHIFRYTSFQLVLVLIVSSVVIGNKTCDRNTHFAIVDNVNKILGIQSYNNF